MFLYRQPKVRDEAVVCFYIDLYFEVHINVSNCLFYNSTEKILPQFLVYLLFFHFEQNSIVYNHKKVFQLSIVSTKSEFSTWRDNITFYSYMFPVLTFLSNDSQFNSDFLKVFSFNEYLVHSLTDIFSQFDIILT